MPIAIALLNGNTAPVRTRFGLRLAVLRQRADAAPAVAAAARSARPPRPIRHRNRAPRDRRRDFPCSARAGRTPATATARWHRSFARRGWPARRRGRDRRRRRRCRGSRACPAAELAAALLSGPRRGAPVRSRVGGSGGSCIGTCGCGRGCGGGGSARRLRWLRRRSSCPSGGRSLRGWRRRRRPRTRRRGWLRRRAGGGALRPAARGAGSGAERIAGAGAGARGVAAGARGVAGALGGLGFDLAHGLFQRQPLAGDFGFAQAAARRCAAARSARRAPAHKAHGGSRREHWGPVRQWRGRSAGSNQPSLLNIAGFPVTSR